MGKSNIVNLMDSSAAKDAARLPLISVYGNEARFGNASRQYVMGAAHVAKISANAAGPNAAAVPRTIRLEKTAFLLQNIADGTCKAAMNAGSSDVFLTFKDEGGAEISCRVFVQATSGKITMQFKRIPRNSSAWLTAAAALAVASVKPCRDAYDAFVKHQGIKEVYQFCDEVQYAFLQNVPAEAVLSDDLNMDMINQAVDSGYYTPFPYLAMPVTGNGHPRKASSAKTAQKTEGTKPDLSDYRDGKHIIRHEWEPEQVKRIIPPDFLDTFVPVPEFFRLMNKLDKRIGENMVTQEECGMTEPENIRRDVVNVLLYGNPGTGKTVLAHALSAATGMPLYEVKFDKYTESDEVEGKNKIIAGKLAFTQTDFLEGYEKGGILLLEEINCADQNVITGALNNAIEYPFFIMKDGYQKVNRNPFTVIIATMNVGTEGTMWLNQSFASRFKQKYRVADPSREDFIHFLTNYGYDRDAAEYVHDAYSKVMGLLTSNRATAEYAMNLSTRACLGALENMSEGDDAKTALMDTIVGAIGIVDPQAATDIEKNVIANLPDFKKKGKAKA